MRRKLLPQPGWVDGWMFEVEELGDENGLLDDEVINEMTYEGTEIRL